MSQKIKIRRQSRYAPIRYEATRDYAGRLGKRFTAEAQKGDQARLAFVKKQLLPLIKLEVEKYGHQDGPGPIQAELVNIQIYAGFQSRGRVIFDVHKRLSKSLLVTDSADIPCEALSFPHDAFYLHFGSGTGLIDTGMEIEGAFIQYSPEQRLMMIDLAPVGAFAVGQFWRLPMGDALTGVSVHLDRDDESISQALDRSIDDVIAQNVAALEQYAELERKLTEQYGQVVKVPSRAQNLADKRPLLHQALQLVVNTLFYLSAIPEDIREDWENDVPQAQRDQLSAEKLGTRKATENFLANQGYVKVKMVGQQYADSANAIAVSDEIGSGRSVSMHLRRGHFRNQPYGPKHSLRKTVFIAPIVVNPGKGEAAGRIYEAS
jgi:hypothetical protein